MYHYKVKKKKNLAKLKKGIPDGEFFLEVTRFDQETGEPKEPQMIRLEKSNLLKRKLILEEEVRDLAEIIKDMEALERKK